MSEKIEGCDSCDFTNQPVTRYVPEHWTVAETEAAHALYRYVANELQLSVLDFSRHAETLGERIPELLVELATSQQLREALERTTSELKAWHQCGCRSSKAQRYEPHIHDGHVYMGACNDGGWITEADHLAEIQRLKTDMSFGDMATQQWESNAQWADGKRIEAEREVTRLTTALATAEASIAAFEFQAVERIKQSTDRAGGGEVNDK